MIHPQQSFFQMLVVLQQDKFFESKTHTCREYLTEKERSESSAWRELLAIQYALKSFPR